MSHKTSPTASDRKHEYLSEVQLNPYGFVGNSPAMLRVYEILERIGPKNVTVNIVGESGTGKELVARAIHNEGPRKEKPF